MKITCNDCTKTSNNKMDFKFIENLPHVCAECEPIRHKAIWKKIIKETNDSWALRYRLSKLQTDIFFTEGTASEKHRVKAIAEELNIDLIPMCFEKHWSTMESALPYWNHKKWGTPYISLSNTPLKLESLEEQTINWLLETEAITEAKRLESIGYSIS